MKGHKYTFTTMVGVTQEGLFVTYFGIVKFPQRPTTLEIDRCDNMSISQS